MFCQYCGKEIDDNVKYCTHCGKRVVEDDSADNQPTAGLHVCPVCGSDVSPEDRFCMSCGAPLNENPDRTAALNYLTEDDSVANEATTVMGSGAVMGMGADTGMNTEATVGMGAAVRDTNATTYTNTPWSAGHTAEMPTVVAAPPSQATHFDPNNTADRQMANNAANQAAPAPHQKNTAPYIIGGIVAIVAIVAITVIVVTMIGAGNNTTDQSNQTTQQQAQTQPQQTQSSTNSSTAQDTDKQKEAADKAKKEAEQKAREEAQAKSGYILPDSASRYYSKDELEQIDLYDLYIARNEIFARHGREFSNSDLQNYFNAQPWYHPQYSPEQFDSMPDPLNQYEKANSDLIREVEQERNSPYL